MPTTASRERLIHKAIALLVLAAEPAEVHRLHDVRGRLGSRRTVRPVNYERSELAKVELRGALPGGVCRRVRAAGDAETQLPHVVPALRRTID